MQISRSQSWAKAGIFAVIALVALFICLALPQQGYAATFKTVETADSLSSIDSTCKVGSYYYYTCDKGLYATKSAKKKGVRLNKSSKVAEISATSAKKPTVVFLAKGGYSDSYYVNYQYDLCKGTVKSASKASVKKIKTYYTGGNTLTLLQTYGKYAFVKSALKESSGTVVKRLTLKNGKEKRVAKGINNHLATSGKFVYFDSESGGKLHIFDCAKSKVVKKLAYNIGGKAASPSGATVVSNKLFVLWNGNSGESGSKLVRYNKLIGTGAKVVYSPASLYEHFFGGAKFYWMNWSNGGDWEFEYHVFDLKTLKAATISESTYGAASQKWYW